MNLITKEPHLFWSGVILLTVAFLVFGKPVSSESQSARDRIVVPAAQEDVYTGPSTDYAATPHPGALTYGR